MMTNANLEVDWIIDSAKTEFTGVDCTSKLRQALKSSTANKYHLLIKNSALDFTLYSAGEEGWVLSVALQAALNTNDSLVFVQTFNDSVYVALMTAGRVYKEFHVFNDSAASVPFIETVISKFIELHKVQVFYKADGPDNKTANQLFPNISAFEDSNLDINKFEKLEKYQLIKSSKIQIPVSVRNIALAAVSVVLMAFMVFYAAFPEEVEEPKVVNIYQPLIDKLQVSGTNAKFQLARLYFDLLEVKSLQGWEIKKAISKKELTVFTVEPNEGGNFKQLKEWAQERNYITEQIKGVFTIIISIENSAPLTEAVIPSSVGDEAAYISNALSSWWDGATIKEKGSKSMANSAWVESQYEIGFSKWTAYDLDSLGSLLATRSLSLDEVYLEKRKIGEPYLHGYIHLTVFGK